jgi:hypothetical protein
VKAESPFYVPGLLDFLGGLVSRFPQQWLGLGNLETFVLATELAPIAVKQPLFVCGLARAGSTLLHEVICSHPGVASHRLKDFPFLSTPYWWRRATSAVRASEPRERPHGDRMMVTSESPDALEEMLWMAFFPACHDPGRDNRLGAHDRNAAFEAYYPNHIRKLLLAERAARYAAKANYHVARLPYLLRLFPDARIVLPVRDPVGHVSSLMRQHEWFSQGHRTSRKSLAYMRRSGHFEFGLDRRPLNLGDGLRVQEVQAAWKCGEEARGWALYWDLVYRHLADQLETNEAVRRATLVVRFEELCDRPAEVLTRVLRHCELAETNPILDKYVPAIRRPDYYRSSLSPGNEMMIRVQTRDTASRFGLEAGGESNVGGTARRCTPVVH